MTATITPSRALVTVWAMLVECEPALTTLKSNIRRCEIPSSGRVALWRAFECRLACYIGKHARRDTLRSEQLFERARTHLYGIYSRRVKQTRKAG